MAPGCCGFFAFVFLIVVIVYVFKIMGASSKINRMKTVKTTTFKELLDNKEVLSRAPQYLEIKGEVICEQPINTPFSKIETVFYEFKVTQYYTTSSGEDDTDHTDVVHKSRGSTPFKLSDETEVVQVVLEPTLDFKLEGEKEQEFNDVQFIEGVPVVYKNVPTGATDISYEYTENYISVGSRVYFIGNVLFKDGAFHLTRGGDFSIVSDASERKLLKKTIAERAGSIRTLFFFAVLFILAFVGFYGKPEGLADITRSVMDFLIDVFEEID
jgi:hypothetical protein